MRRRHFLKAAAYGSATASAGIFFPKPATSYSFNWLLSVNANPRTIQRNFLQFGLARNPSQRLPTGIDPAVANVVGSLQRELVAQGFTTDPTPFSQRLGNINNPLWGRARREPEGPNPGFGTVQIVENAASPIHFSASTTASIDRAMAFLRQNEKLTPDEVDGLLIPTRSLFSDWGTWAGDRDPQTGETNPSSSTVYETRYGEVTRLYEVKKPGPKGFGEIAFFVKSNTLGSYQFTIQVQFA